MRCNRERALAKVRDENNEGSLRMGLIKSAPLFISNTFTTVIQRTLKI